MIGIAISARREWETVLKYYGKNVEDLVIYPFGNYFQTELEGKNVLFFKCGIRKVASSASTQYMIDKFELEKIIVVGTCAGIDDKYKNLDIFIPNCAVQYDRSIKEIEPLIKESFIVEFDLSSYNFEFNSGVIGTADKAVVIWKDYLELKNNDITIADTESAAIAYICKMNNIKCIVIKGISDFPLEDINDENLEKQKNMFITNVPIVTKLILDNYLRKLI